VKTLFLAPFLLMSAVSADEPVDLLKNGQFDQDAIQWYQDPNTTAFWDTPDASFDPFSGSAWIVDDDFTAFNEFRSVVEQCVLVDHEGTYFVGAKGYMPTTQAPGQLVLRYLYIYGNACGLDAGAVGYLTVPRTDSWQKVGVSTPVVHTPGWIPISFGIERAVDRTEFSGRFDDVIVSDDEMFISGFD
jgi:hypothetical protein